MTKTEEMFATVRDPELQRRSRLAVEGVGPCPEGYLTLTLPLSIVALLLQEQLAAVPVAMMTDGVSAARMEAITFSILAVSVDNALTEKEERESEDDS